MSLPDRNSVSGLSMWNDMLNSKGRPDTQPLIDSAVDARVRPILLLRANYRYRDAARKMLGIRRPFRR